MSAARFVIEGVWSGHRASQSKVVHRQAYASAGWKKLRAWAEQARCISFTDGTSLDLSVRDCKPRERVEEVRGYTRLIEDCARHDVASVVALLAAQQAARAGAIHNRSQA